MTLTVVPIVIPQWLIEEYLREKSQECGSLWQSTKLRVPWGPEVDCFHD
jgi:hypothetical protein